MPKMPPNKVLPKKTYTKDLALSFWTICTYLLNITIEQPSQIKKTAKSKAKGIAHKPAAQYNSP